MMVALEESFLSVTPHGSVVYLVNPFPHGSRREPPIRYNMLMREKNRVPKGTHIQKTIEDQPMNWLATDIRRLTAS